MADEQIKTIVNDDGKVGYIQSSSKYFTSEDYNRRFHLLKELSSTKQNKLAKVAAGGVDKTSLDTSEKADTTGPNVLNFLSKLQKFQFAPPSDNLWVVRITTYNTDGTQSNIGLATLYKSILEANASWNTIFTTGWKVDVSEKFLKKEDYIRDFQLKSGMFLAQNVNFTPQSVTTTDSIFSEGQQHSGFFNYGFAVQNRQINRSIKISFLVSNWDICDILFEPWIAAVAQRGMIEDGISSSIKARITIEEYSQGVPSSYVTIEGKKGLECMSCRKQYIFDGCVPINRGSIERDYDFNNAGTFKTSIVQFKFQDYQIKYLF